MDPFLWRNSLHIKVIDVDSDDYVTTHMIQGGGELLDWTLVKKPILNSAQTQTLGAADLSCARQDWGSVLAQNADGSCTRTCRRWSTPASALAPTLLLHEGVPWCWYCVSPPKKRSRRSTHWPSLRRFLNRMRTSTPARYGGSTSLHSVTCARPMRDVLP